MDDDELRKLLDRIQNDIQNTPADDDTSNQILRDLEADISEMNERLGENPIQVHPSIVQRLESAVSHFEVTHPELTTSLVKLLDTLSNTGI